MGVAELSSREVALKYKQLWMVEQLFRSMKSPLETRPIYHKRHDTIRGHVFCSFLALVLRKELNDRLAARGEVFECDDILHDLENLQETRLEHQRKAFFLGAESMGNCGKVFPAAGVTIPPTLRSVKEANVRREPQRHGTASRHLEFMVPPSFSRPSN